MKKRMKYVIGFLLITVMAFGLVACSCNPATDDERVTVTVVNGIVQGGGSAKFDIGDSVTITATVPQGKFFVNWKDESGEVKSTANPYTFTAEKDITLTASFADELKDKIYYTIVVDGGIIKDADSETSFLNGSAITVKAVVPEFYEFEYWTVDGVKYSEAEEFNYTVTKNIKFTAVYSFISLFKLTLQGCTSTSYYVEGSEFVTVTANTINNYRFVNWTVNDETVTTAGNTYEFELTEDTEVIANFKRINIEISASTTNDAIGVMVTGGEGGLFEEGDTATVTAATRNGITVTWKTPGGTTVSTANPYNFTVGINNVELVAYFSTTYTVTVEGGMIRGSGLTTDVFGAGSNVIVEADIEDDEIFVSWTDGAGGFVTYANPYVIKANANVVLKANKQKKQANVKTYIFEAENADLTKCFSSNGITHSVVGNHGSEDHGDPELNELYKASNGFGAAKLNNYLNNEIVWRVNSDMATTAVLVIRMANANYDGDYASFNMDLNKNKLGFFVNAEALDYNPFRMDGGTALPGASSLSIFGTYLDYTIALEVPLIAGQNVITMKLLQNYAGPNVDCIKLITAANLTWTPRMNGGAPIADYGYNV